MRRSFAVGLALQVALAAILIGGVGFALVYAALARESRAAIVRQVDTDIAGLVDVYASDGKHGLAARIGDRMALEPREGETPVYLALDAAGRPIAGNLARWPDVDAGTSALAEIETRDGMPVLARATVLRGGVRLLAGRSTVARDAALAGQRRLFLIVLVAMAVVSLAIGLWSARRLGRRVDAINGVFAAVREGRLEARASPASDEIGALALNVNRTLDRIERLIAAQRNITDHTAHEIRTPLMHLDAELLRAIDRTLDPEVTASLGRARSQVRSLLALFDSLLDIAAAQALRGDLRGLGEIDLSEVAQSVAELYGPSAEEAGLDFVADIAPGVVMRGDAMQMTRLLVNLLDNAFKYGAAGGRIGLSVAGGPRIVVDDAGPGVAPEDRARVFDRYVRAGGSAESGHGLGLSLVRAIAERHDLAVSIEDAGPGARFVVAPETAT